MQNATLQTAKQTQTRLDRRVWIVIVILCIIGGAAATRRIVALESPPPAATAPPASNPFAGLDEHFQHKDRVTLLHVVPSLLLVLLLPLQFAQTLRQRHPRWHRWTGRVAMLAGIVAGGTALWLSASPVGGIVESSATVFYGCLFLIALANAWRHIRHRRVGMHRVWTTRMAAIGLGVATTRPIIAICFATARLTGLTPHQFFGPAMWLGLTSTFLAGEWWLRKSRRPAR